MEIIKYQRQTTGKYKVFLDSGKELLLYEEVILKYELLLKKQIQASDLLEIEKYNQEFDVYYAAVRSLNKKYKTIKETKEYLMKKAYSKEFVDKAISSLIKQGYLNDQKFAKSYINTQIMTTVKGPLKIIRELSLKGVPMDIINKEIAIYDDVTQLEKMEKIANKLLSSNKSKGGFVLKNKISTYLIGQGYENDLISTVLVTKDFSNNDDITKKEYEKLYKRLSKKYEGKELEYKIKEKLYQKGLVYEA